MQWVALNQNGIVFLSGHGCNLIAHIMLKAHMIWQCLFLIAVVIEMDLVIIQTVCFSLVCLKTNFALFRFYFLSILFFYSFYSLLSLKIQQKQQYSAIQYSKQF